MQTDKAANIPDADATFFFLLVSFSDFFYKKRAFPKNKKLGLCAATNRNQAFLYGYV